MNFWVSFWAWFLLFGLAVFAVLAVVVTVGGAFDIRALVTRIREQHERE